MKFRKGQRIRVKNSVVNSEYFEGIEDKLESLLGEKGVVVGNYTYATAISVCLNSGVWWDFHPKQIEPRDKIERPKISSRVIKNGKITEE